MAGGRSCFGSEAVSAGRLLSETSSMFSNGHLWDLDPEHVD